MMRQLITLRRIFIAGAKNFLRNSWLSVAATAVMVVALVIVLSAIVLNITTKNTIKELSTNLKVSVYLKDEMDDSLRQKLQQEFTDNQYVDSVEYISKEDAQKDFVTSFKDDSKLLEGLALIGGNSLPASLEVSVTDLQQIEDVGNIAKQGTYSEVVDTVSLGKTEVKNTIERAGNIQRFITTASIIAAAIFAIVSMLIIFNTIRMAIFTRSDEIRTQKLLGATPNYIRGPFLVESSMYGIIAGIISASLVVTTIYSLGGKVSTQPEFAESYTFFTDNTIITLMYFASVLLGVLVGVVSSSLAMNRYLKIKHW